MNFVRYELTRAGSDHASRGPVQIDLDPTEWHWEDAVQDRHLDADRLTTSWLFAALLLAAIVLAPAVEAVVGRTL
jgi:hypothetical protein